jgi:hypothetical protein
METTEDNLIGEQVKHVEIVFKNVTAHAPNPEEKVK